MKSLRRIMFAALLAGLTSLGVLAAPADEPATKAQLKKDMKAKAKAAKNIAPPMETAKPSTSPKPNKPMPTAIPQADLVAKIDAGIDKQLIAEKLTASPQSTDAEFLRRVYLDIVGTIPTADEARKFLDDTTPTKREKLIDFLLTQPGYGTHQADLWMAKLYLKDSDNRFLLKEPLADWLAKEFNANTPWNSFTTKLLTATGDVETHPEVTFFLANRTIDKLTDAVGTHILGQSVACAQCHNHPFTSMKQTEYWGMANFFAKTNIERPKNMNKGGDNTKIGVKEGMVSSKAKDFFPEAALKVSPSFLGGEKPKMSERDPYRPALAAWITARDNPYFAKATVNRVWGQLFGEGLVNPVEDMHEGNPATHPEILELLADQFIASGYDLKQLTRTLMLTKTYQRTSKPTAGNDKDETLYSHRMMKVMMPEQLYDSIMAIQNTAGAIPEPRLKGAVKPNRGPGTSRDAFVNFFLSGADKANAAEYEAGIPQALKLMNSRQSLGNNPSAVRQFIKPGNTAAQNIESLYLAALSRRPTAEETAKLQKYLADNGKDSYADVLWALTNSSEFGLIR
jgi:hypothetical protein